MRKDLTANEVSIINVGSTAYMRYAKIFMRQNQESMGCKVAIVTDLDVKPNDDDGQFDVTKESEQRKNVTEKVDTANYPDISWHIAEHWTLEWCLNESGKFGELFKEAVSKVHTGTDSFKKKNGQFKTEDFKAELTNKLRKYKIDGEGKRVAATPLKKVEVAYQFAKLVKEVEIDYEHFDGDSAKYLVDAIKSQEQNSWCCLMAVISTRSESSLSTGWRVVTCWPCQEVERLLHYGQNYTVWPKNCH